MRHEYVAHKLLDHMDVILAHYTCKPKISKKAIVGVLAKTYYIVDKAIANNCLLPNLLGAALEHTNIRAYYYRELYMELYAS